MHDNLLLEWNRLLTHLGCLHIEGVFLCFFYAHFIRFCINPVLTIGTAYRSFLDMIYVMTEQIQWSSKLLWLRLAVNTVHNLHIGFQLSNVEFQNSEIKIKMCLKPPSLSFSGKLETSSRLTPYYSSSLQQ